MEQAVAFDPKEFGGRLRAAMDAAKLSYRGLQAVIDVDKASLHRIAHGCPPSLDHYLLIERWLAKLAKHEGE